MPAEQVVIPADIITSPITQAVEAHPSAAQVEISPARGRPASPILFAEKVGGLVLSEMWATTLVISEATGTVWRFTAGRPIRMSSGTSPKWETTEAPMSVL